MTHRALKRIGTTDLQRSERTVSGSSLTRQTWLHSRDASSCRRKARQRGPAALRSGLDFLLAWVHSQQLDDCCVTRQHSDWALTHSPAARCRKLIYQHAQHCCFVVLHAGKELALRIRVDHLTAIQLDG